MRIKKTKTEDRKAKTVFAKKSFGQNFLTDQNYIEKIVSALNPQPKETIVEIGAGRGALTKKLVESGANVLAVELDKDLIPLLKENFGSYKNFVLIEQDALKIDFRQLLKAENQKPKAKLAANLPFYISTAILQKLIEQRDCFSEMILMFQREVVERITAKAGSAERGFLTVLVETFLNAEKLFDVPPEAFRPAPKVWSTVARLKPKEQNEIEISDEKLFREIVGACFMQKRKTILNNLKNFALADAEKKETSRVLEQSRISPERRAETLTVSEWKRLVETLRS